MTDELKHPADGVEQEITSESAGSTAYLAEETNQDSGGLETEEPEATRDSDGEDLGIEDSNSGQSAGESESEAESDFTAEPRPAPKLERLQKILAQAGVASRRHAEELITGGRVQVNGQIVTVLGTKADAGRDHIRVDGKLLHGAERLRYFVLNKPKGYVTTVTDPEGRPTVMEFFAKTGERLYPVGRLDYLSEGLLLVTNDGELANKLTKASSGVEKTYLVKVSGQPGEDRIERLRQGVVIERGKLGEGKVHTAPARIEQVRAGDNPWYEVVLIEGRNRELRKMFSEIGHHVEKIRRVGYGPLVLDLEPGKLRELDLEEVTALRRAADGKFKPRRFKTSLMLPKEAGQSAELRAGKAAIRAGKSFKPRDTTRKNDGGRKPAFKPRERGAADRPGAWKRKREDSRSFGKGRDEGSGAKPSFGAKPAFSARPRYGERAGEKGGLKGRDSRGPGTNFSRPKASGATPIGARPSFEGRGSRGPEDRPSGSSGSTGPRSFGARPGGKPPFRGRGPDRVAPRSFDRNAGPNRPPRDLDPNVRPGTTPARRSGSAPRKPFTPREQRPAARAEERAPRLEIRPVEFSSGPEKPAGRPPRPEGSSPAFRGAGKTGPGGPSRSSFGGGRSKPAYGSKPKSGFGSRAKPAFGSKPSSDFASKPKAAFDSKSKPAFGSKPSFGGKPKPFDSKSRPGGSRPNAGPDLKSRPSSRPSGKKATGKRLGRPKSSQGRKRS
jgi:23S rRNA pseudouridine2605 synthase